MSFSPPTWEAEDPTEFLFEFPLQTLYLDEQGKTIALVGQVDTGSKD